MYDGRPVYRPRFQALPQRPGEGLDERRAPHAEDGGRFPNVSFDEIFDEIMPVIRATMALKAVAEAYRLIEGKNFGKVVFLP